MHLRAFRFLAPAVLAGMALAQDSTRDLQAPPSRVRKAIERAKADSLKDVSLIPISGLPTGVTDLDAAMGNGSILIVQPVAKITTFGHPDHLMTWYKAKVVEVLWKQKRTSTDPVTDVPIQFRQLGPKEILLPTAGGNLNIEGINVHETYPINSLLGLHTDYLVCVNLRHDGQVATLIDGLDGVLSVGAGNTLKPLGNAAEDVVRDIHARFADNLQFVRSYIQERGR